MGARISTFQEPLSGLLVKKFAFPLFFLLGIYLFVDDLEKKSGPLTESLRGNGEKGAAKPKISKKVSRKPAVKKIKIPLFKKRASSEGPQTSAKKVEIAEVVEFPCFAIPENRSETISQWFTEPASQLEKTRDSKVLLGKNSEGQKLRYLSERKSSGRKSILVKKFGEDESGFPVFLGYEPSEVSLDTLEVRRDFRVEGSEETLEIKGPGFQGRAILVNNKVRELELVLPGERVSGHCLGSNCSCKNI